MSKLTLQPGQTFNPMGMFIGAFIPNALMQFKGLSPLAKLTWARLVQYAGYDGACYPALSTLANEVGKSRRQIQRVLNELEEQQFIRREAPDREGMGQKQTTRYFFLWHPVFAQSTTRDRSVPSSYEPRAKNDPSPRDEADTSLGTDPSPKENQRKDQFKTTTGDTQPKSSTKQQENRCCDSLSANQKEYVELAVRKAQAEGAIRKSPSAFRCALEAKAREGTLDISDFDYLEAWAANENARKALADKTEEEKRDLQDQENEKALRHEEYKAFILARISSSGIPADQWHAKVLAAVGQASRNFKGEGVFGLAPHTELRILKELFPELNKSS